MEAVAKRLVVLEKVADGGRPFACIVAATATGEILAEAANKVAQTGNPTAHAEMLAGFSETQGNWRCNRRKRRCRGGLPRGTRSTS